MGAETWAHGCRPLGLSMEGDPMKSDGQDPDMRDEYDFSDGVRGKYA